MNQQPRYVHAILCDDIREEREGKLSFMGVPSPYVEVEGPLPAAASQRFVVLWFNTPLSQPFGRFALRFEGAEVEGIEETLDLTEAVTTSAGSDKEDGVRVGLITVELSTLLIRSSGTVGLVLETEAGEMRLWGHPIRVRNPEVASS